MGGDCGGGLEALGSRIREHGVAADKGNWIITSEVRELSRYQLGFCRPDSLANQRWQQRRTRQLGLVWALVFRPLLKRICMAADPAATSPARPRRLHPIGRIHSVTEAGEMEGYLG